MLTAYTVVPYLPGTLVNCSASKGGRRVCSGYFLQAWTPLDRKRLAEKISRSRSGFHRSAAIHTPPPYKLSSSASQSGACVLEAYGLVLERDTLSSLFNNSADMSSTTEAASATAPAKSLGMRKNGTLVAS